MATKVKKYVQLNEHERFAIELLLKNGKTQADIARELHKSRSTISREIARNKTENGYYSECAQNVYIARRAYPKQDRKFRKLSDEAIAYIVEHLHKRSSP